MSQIFLPGDIRGVGSGGNAPELNYFTTFNISTMSLTPAAGIASKLA
jgi:hypothetical protein